MLLTDWSISFPYLLPRKIKHCFGLYDLICFRGAPRDEKSILDCVLVCSTFGDQRPSLTTKKSRCSEQPIRYFVFLNVFSKLLPLPYPNLRIGFVVTDSACHVTFCTYSVTMCTSHWYNAVFQSSRVNLNVICPCLCEYPSLVTNVRLQACISRNNCYYIIIICTN